MTSSVKADQISPWYSWWWKSVLFSKYLTSTTSFHYKKLVNILYLFYKWGGNRHSKFTSSSFSSALSNIPVRHCVKNGDNCYVISPYNAMSQITYHPEFTSEHLRLKELMVTLLIRGRVRLEPMSSASRDSTYNHYPSYCERQGNLEQCLLMFRVLLY